MWPVDSRPARPRFRLLDLDIALLEDDLHRLEQLRVTPLRSEVEAEPSG